MRGRRPLSVSYLPAVLTEVVLLERNGLPRARAERVVAAAVVGTDGVAGRLGLLGGLAPDVAVLGDARPRRDELADDDVLLEAQQRVALGVHRCLREDPGGLLEGRRR